MNITDLPAMSAHVQELISLTNSSQSTANDLAEVILKDFSLTNKVLQVANSAYYSRGVPINSVHRAITVIGFTVVRQLAMAIALFEELIKSAEMQEHLIRLLTKSFLSAMFARIHTEKKGLYVNPDEAFLCSLLYNLGEIVVAVYLPELYQEIAVKVQKGKDLDTAAKETLNNLTFIQIAKEIVLLWNFSKQIHGCLLPTPPKPKSSYDADANLKTVVIFSNHLVSLLCAGKSPKRLVFNCRRIVKIDLKESIEIFERSIEASTDISYICRKGFEMLKIQEILQHAQSFIKK